MSYERKDELTAEWLTFYAANTGEIDTLADKGGADWESLCVGWCMAKGATAQEAYEFYGDMVRLGAF